MSTQSAAEQFNKLGQEFVDRFKRGQKVTWATDFDGTISPYVYFPDEAHVNADARAALTEFARCGVRSSAVSARPVSFLRSELSEPIELFGAFGIEHAYDGKVMLAPGEEIIRDQILEAVGELILALDDAGLPSTYHAREANYENMVYLQNRTTSLGVSSKYAMHGNPSSDVEKKLTSVLFDFNFDDFGFVLKDGGDHWQVIDESDDTAKFGKAKAIQKLCEESDFVVFCGDDPGDLEAAKTVRDRGGAAVVAAHKSDEIRRGSPQELLDLATVATDSDEPVDQLGAAMRAISTQILASI